jgi:hypothetical protein
VEAAVVASTSSCIDSRLELRLFWRMRAWKLGLSKIKKALSRCIVIFIVRVCGQ